MLLDLHQSVCTSQSKKIELVHQAIFPHEGLSMRLYKFVEFLCSICDSKFLFLLSVHTLHHHITIQYIVTLSNHHTPLESRNHLGFEFKFVVCQQSSSYLAVKIISVLLSVTCLDISISHCLSPTHMVTIETGSNRPNFAMCGAYQSLAMHSHCNQQWRNEIL